MEPDHLGDLLGEPGILGQLERALPVRLEVGTSHSTGKRLIATALRLLPSPERG
jgi:hypothetical protein